MKKFKILLILLLIALLACSCSDEDLSEDGSGAKESSSNTRAGEDLDAENATILIYMIASDLESQSGCASTDIEEICNANLDDNVNIVIQTGGSTYWVNENVDASKVERFTIKNGQLNKVDVVGNAKKINMTDKKTLSDFITWGVNNYPADRYGVILWDHGGGSVTGYGVDEYHEDSTLSLSQIRDAFKTSKDKTGVKMNFVGFDACLMGTVETAYALYPYADYMIASEETEPGSGWYYTDWLTMLSENPGVNMKDLGKQLINDFVDGPDASYWDQMTLALYDLSDMKKLYKELCSYMADTREVLLDSGFSQMAEARSDAKSYGDDEYDQIDLKSYLKNAQVEDDSLEEILDDMIVYYNGNLDDSYGIAMYYPYSYLDYYSDMYTMMGNIGMDDSEYLGYFNDFVSILSKGNGSSQSTHGNQSFLGQLLGYIDADDTEEDYSDEDWYDEDAADSGFDESAMFSTDEDLVFTEKDDQYILDLTDDQWNSIEKVEMDLYLKDGDGYLYFGCDSLVDYNDDGDLIASYDCSWVAIDGQIVPFYIISDQEKGDKWQATGYVPAILNAGTNNEQDIDLYIRWDSDHEDGYVMGYSLYKHDENTISMANKKYLSLNAGDTLDFYCDYYTSDGNYDDSYIIDTIKVSSDGLEVSYEDIDSDIEIEYGYRLTDYYQNEYYTEMLTQ